MHVNILKDGQHLEPNARLQTIYSIAYHMNMCNGPACFAIFLFLFEDVHTLFPATFPTYRNIFR